jgi:hypothetical protein
MKSLMKLALVAHLLMVQVAWSQTTQPADDFKTAITNQPGHLSGKPSPFTLP